MLEVGCARREIIPAKPLVLGGFDFRKEPFEAIGQPIYARAILLAGKHAIISLDLLFVGDNLFHTLKATLSKTVGLEHISLQVCATHSHSSFQTADYQSPRLGSFDNDYNTFVVSQCIDALLEAKANSQRTSLSIASSTCSIAINRRKVLDDGSIKMAPNPEGDVDQTATLLRFDDESGKTVAIIAHNHCHPTTTGDNTLSGEYPGVVCAELEGRFTGSTALFLQGFCGDIRPALVKGDEFYRGTYKDVVRNGKALATAYGDAIEQASPCQTTGHLIYQEVVVDLPVEAPMSSDQLKAWSDGFDAGSIQREWSQHWLAQPEGSIPSTVSLNASALNIEGAAILLGLSGEIVNHFNQYAKELSSTPILCTGYCNGMAGYVPTAQQIAEGGYEPELSAYYFYLPNTFSPEAEPLLKATIRRLLTATTSASISEQ
ncbi:hypothetical protein E1162_12760 [Rhodobacteraceae bacterium RKSG542]|uniref:hypothetical protein n=1 Tax=Pseudovibrio flavus TaxID=2529854 RepID=UPI0012BBAAF6|nr:hypothetical protein [Pseudovibrio flavus]MTI18110.1 hypothetical protein [Pseudovibrio flavus]